MSEMVANDREVARLFHRLSDLEDCLYLQLYYWGRDVMHAHGNQLVTHGFERIAKKTKEGTSRYRIELGDGLIELHGWCLGWYREGQPGFVFVRGRHRLFLWDSPAPPQPECVARESLRAPVSAEDWSLLASMMQNFVHWMLGYESWVEAQHGGGYRSSIFREYDKLPNAMHWLPPEVQREWLELFLHNPLTVPAARRFLRDKMRRVVEPARIGCGWNSGSSRLTKHS
ncbi:hypothetical protein FEM03_02095 [Phragmitibacter flavus]|uniref:Uncharacterized protein n=1 Tax=Phragmitibacter flavus TaxID=2576071 RepID=A0A5R8KIU1_9BACT|nr:hypothetical protein [Phragmitibacter flavus]TLD72170.1 hypothetical protein FEM03_02095 [Phragmitibacter flavus]